MIYNLFNSNGKNTFSAIFSRTQIKINCSFPALPLIYMLEFGFQFALAVF